MSGTQIAIALAGGLAMFLFGMKVMSEGLQKVAGAKMRKVLGVMTGNRLLGVGTGLLVTCAVQSSSATTVMLVGFVHAGLINLTQSIGVVMGANIGTTFTGWLVALLGFKVKVAAMALPAIAIGFYCVASGAFVNFSPQMRIGGSDEVVKFLTEDVEELTGGKFTFEDDAVKAAHLMIAHMDRKRAALKLKPMMYEHPFKPTE